MAKILQKRRRGKRATIVSVPPIFCPKGKPYLADLGR
jgi:hypothetical protein